MGLYLSRSKRKTSKSVRVGRLQLKSIRADKRRSGRARLRVPASTAAGLYYLVACSDYLGKVRERSEANNCRAARQRVRIFKTSPQPVPLPPAPGLPPIPTITISGIGGPTRS